MGGSAQPERRCAWCSGPVPTGEGPGRPRAYCSRSCRQRAYDTRRLLAPRRNLIRRVEELQQRLVGSNRESAQTTAELVKLLQRVEEAEAALRAVEERLRAEIEDRSATPPTE